MIDGESKLSTLSLDVATRRAASLLRDIVCAYLDEHPDAVLQLTGGMDSRALLAAIPPKRRRHVGVMTLDAPGSEDAEIASSLAEKFAMEHEIISMDGLESLDPEEAYRRVRAAADLVDCSNDPVALAAVKFAEEKSKSHRRIEGLGGEVVRGFYYYGPNFRPPFRRRQVEVLANWRLFTNGAVPEAMLTSEFADWARTTIVDDILNYLNGVGLRWLEATDAFYLQQRMHRWAGVISTGTCIDRVTVNPMLDRRFLDIGRALQPAERRDARYLAGLICELDSELGMIRLDGRPAPAFFVRGRTATAVSRTANKSKRVVAKVRQRLRGERRPPVGGEIIASKAQQHLRDHPELLASLSGSDVLSANWIERWLEGAEEATPAAIGFLVNLLSASAAISASPTEPKLAR